MKLGSKKTGNVVCTVGECGHSAMAKGLCKLHYQRAHRTGSPHVGRPCLHLPVEEKFWHYVDHAEVDACWTWNGYRDEDGYGRLRVGKTQRGAHRVSYELHFGPIPAGLMVRHQCHNPSCVNPTHLQVGTHLENMADRMNAGRWGRNEDAAHWKFPNEIVEAVRAAVGTYEEIGRRFNVSTSQVGNIRRGTQRAAAAPIDPAAGIKKTAPQPIDAQRGRQVWWAPKIAASVCKLTPEQVAEVKRRREAGEKVADLARELGVHRTTLSKVTTGKYAPTLGGAA